MAITRVQAATPGTNAGGSTNTIATSAFVSNTTTGNAIIVGIALEGATTSVTDTQNNSYTLVAKSKRSGSPRVEIWIAENITGGASNIVTSTNGFNDGAIFAEEWSGLALYSSFDRSVWAAQTSGHASPLDTGPSVTTHQPNELVFVVAQLDISGTTNLSVGTGFSNFTTARSTFCVGAVESQVVSTIGAQEATMATDNTGVGNSILLATFADTPVSKSSFTVNNLRPHAFSPGLAR